MNPAARRWFDLSTHASDDFDLAGLVAAKQRAGTTVSVVIPAKNEAGTVADVVRQIDTVLVSAGLVDELVVIDSDSTDATAAMAAAAGATVRAAADIETGLSSVPGKGEALWRSLFVTSGDIVVFVDADLTEWGAHFVSGLLGPMLRPGGENVLLVKGFYDRLADDLPGAAEDAAPQGGRVTELVARPLLNLYWPDLAAVVQPLAGEWAIRRSLAEQLPFPVGYGIEFATLTDTASRHGLSAVAQVDLGRRGHRHQNVHDLGVMAAEILSTAMRRLGHGSQLNAQLQPNAQLHQYQRSKVDPWRIRSVPTTERPPARSLAHYGTR
jgi:glucosyl-3-phosphoglycerate synthase